MVHFVHGYITYCFAVTTEPNENTEKLQKQSNKSSVNNSPSLEKPCSKEKKQPDQWTKQGYSRLFF